MRYQPETHSASIVLIGKFNSAIFSPGWLAKFSIITDEELRISSVEVVHPEITQFSVGRFILNVQPNRFSISTTQEPFALILDDVLAIFSLLSHTPLSQVGINYDIQFKFDSNQRRLALGRALAPLKPWGDFGKRIEVADGTLPSGMVNLMMQESEPADRERGWRKVHVKPLEGDKSHTGVRINVNDHFETTASDADGVHPILRILEDRFDASLSESKDIVSQLMDYASKL